MRKSFFITAFLIAAALGALLLLAFHQFQLYGKHEQIISQAEKLTFQYAVIREAIIEDIVQGRPGELAAIAPAVEDLQQGIVKLLDSPLIPAEYKFSFMQQIDLPGLVLLLRRSGAEEQDRSLPRLINENARIIGERFMLLERLVLGYAKQKLVDFQAVVIGILALIVFLISTLLLITYRFLIMPVAGLGAQVDSVIQGHQNRIAAPGGWSEVARLADRINRLLAQAAGSRETAQRLELILSGVNLAAEKIAAAGEVKAMCQAVCRALLVNPEYILAWIGIEEGEGGAVSPLAADGSSTMTGEECQECFGALLAAQEGSSDPVLLAMRSGEPVIRQDILAGVPKGPFKNTPMATGRVDSISVPIGRGGEIFGVLTVYVMARESLLDIEAGTLAGLGRILAGRLAFFDTLQTLAQERRVRDCLGEKMDVVILTLDRGGIVRAADTCRPDSPFRKGAEKWLGQRLGEVALPQSATERVSLADAVAGGRRCDCTVELAGFAGVYAATLLPLESDAPAEAAFRMILIPPAKNTLLQPENFDLAYAAAVGQFAGTVAHELTDLSNGIINYAQMLSDEMAGDPDGEQRRHLARIIAGGEKVAEVVEPLLAGQHDVEFTDDIADVQEIVGQVSLLAGAMLRKEGISVHFTVEPPSLRHHRQQLRLLLLTLLCGLRLILTRRGRQKEPGKEVSLAIVQFREEGAEMIRISAIFSAPSVGGEGMEGDLPACFWLAKELVRNMGGEIALTVPEEGKSKVELILPA